jgi:hypothetical protein
MSEAVRTELFASSAITASGNTATFSLNTASSVMVGVDITGGSGTIVFDLWAQASDDGGTTWYDVPHDISMASSDTSTEVAPTTAVRQIIDNKQNNTPVKFYALYRNWPSDKIRLKWIISGASASLTMSMSMVAK